MGIEKVNHDFRYLDRANNYNVSEFDIASMQIHHIYSPSVNYCLVELKLPSIRQQFTEDQFNETIESLRSTSLHKLNYLAVDNMDFHAFMRKEERLGVDKVRDVRNGVVYTYYFSSTRKVKLYMHDYAMALLVYLNYPIRNFLHRTPCKALKPKCAVYCLDMLAEPVKSYLDDDPSLNVKFSDFFFSYIEDNQRLLMGYTVESVKKVGECFLADEPKYYIQDLSVPYFSTAINKKTKFEKKIIEERKKETSNMSFLGIGEDSPSFYVGSADIVEYGEGTSPTYAIEYNTSTGTDLPVNLSNALESGSFEELWSFDFINLNTRNSFYKYQFNFWAYNQCTLSLPDGFFCAWNTVDDLGLDPSSEEGSQINQLGNTVGWGATNDASSTDTIYTFVSILYPGVVYEEVIEPLPDRPLSMF